MGPQNDTSIARGWIGLNGENQFLNILQVCSFLKINVKIAVFLSFRNPVPGEPFTRIQSERRRSTGFFHSVFHLFPSRSGNSGGC